MIGQVSLLVMLVKLVDHVPMPPPPAKRGRGRPKLSTDQLFLKALVIMIIRLLHTVHELLTVLEQPTPEMQLLRTLLTEQGKYPCRRTWERLWWLHMSSNSMNSHKNVGLPPSMSIINMNCMQG